jgi:DtxR family Mn-dependent transcriptional regulator
MHDTEEALGVIWRQRELGERGIEKIKKIIENGVCGDVYDTLRSSGYITEESGMIILTASGETLARSITRRHRLAERLLTDVLEIRTEEIDKNACQFEHVLSSDVADAICTLLGHPRMCPHGTPIPLGPCCEKSQSVIEAIVSPLTSFPVGQKGHVAYIVTTNHPYLHKVLAMGVVPGAEISLHQKIPSYVIRVGETQIALDKEVAGQIYVRRR